MVLNSRQFKFLKNHRNKHGEAMFMFKRQVAIFLLELSKFLVTIYFLLGYRHHT